MADAPSYYVWDGAPLDVPAVVPRRPSTDDAGGENKTNDANNPPDIETMPTANGHNQDSRLLAGLCKMIGSHAFSVTFPAGVAGITKLATMSETFVVGDVTIVENAAGDTSFTWPADKFPVQQLRPMSVCINEDIAALAACAVAITNGVRVYTRNSAGTLTDIDFTVILSGQ